MAHEVVGKVEENNKVKDARFNVSPEIDQLYGFLRCRWVLYSRSIGHEFVLIVTRQGDEVLVLIAHCLKVELFTKLGYHGKLR